jgi:hypothetical protein
VIDGTIIQGEAVEIANLLNVEFNLSTGWNDSFRKRTGLLLKTKQRIGECESR